MSEKDSDSVVRGWKDRFQRTKISLYNLSIIFYLCAIFTFIIWIYIQFFFSEITAFSLALLGIILTFVLTSMGTLLLKIGKIQGKIEK